MPPVLNIIGSGGIEIGGLGIIYRPTIPYAVVGSGGVRIGGVGVITQITPGITAVIGSGGLEIAGDGVIALTSPLRLDVVGVGGIEIGGKGVIGHGAPIDAHVGSGGIQIAGDGVVGLVSNIGVLPPVLAVVGTGGISIGGVGVINVGLPPVLAVVGSGGIVIGAFRVPELTVVQFISPADLTLAAVKGSGGLEVGGTGVITFTKPPILAIVPPQAVADASILIGGAGVIAVIHPQILQVIADGEVTIGGGTVDPGVFETYVLTGSRGEPSVYSNFPFNSYAHYRNQYFGAGPGGIYLLEGEDDAGDEIHPGVRIGPINFGTHREKRLRLLRCGGDNGNAQVKASDDKGGADYADVIDNIAQVSRDVQGREIVIEITDFETIDHFELVPTVLAKR